MPPHPSARWTAALGLGLLLAFAAPVSANSEPARPGAIDLFERARAAKQKARAPLLPQTRYTVQKQIESIEPVSWLERYGKVKIRSIER